RGQARGADPREAHALPALLAGDDVRDARARPRQGGEGGAHRPAGLRARDRAHAVRSHMIRDIEIAGWISPEALDARDRPLLLRGGARKLRALARWSPAYLAERLGDVELAFKQS